MVTSEVFRDQEGDFQSRKILFQARDHDFSVASRVPAHSKSGRNLGRNSSSQLKKNGSRRSLTSSYSVGSVGSAGSSQSSNKLGVGSSGVGSGSELDLDGLDCVQVADEGEEEDEDDGVEMEGVEEGDEHEDNSDSDDEHSSSDGSEGSIYSDVEGDVDVDETFNDLIGSSNHCELETDDDDEIAPMVHEEPLDPAPLLLSPASDSKRIVQVYVSSKIRENLKLSIRSGYAEAKGSRSYMEDKTTGVTACSLEGYDEVTRQQLAETYPSLAYFAVYDGHNGDDTAKFLQAELHHRFFQHPQFVSDPVTAISLVCETVDTEILDKQNRSVATPKRKRTADDVAGDDEASRYAKTPRDGEEDDEEECELARAKAHASGSLQPISFSGAAAVLTVVATRWTAKREALEKVMYIANIGDCRAVLCTAHGMAVDLTKDHKASQDEEKKRIEASGGFVHNGRLDGILALSRGFGDLAHKTDGHLVATPDVYERVVGPEDEFVLMASDGLFDVLSSQQAVNFIYRKLRLHGDVQLAAQEMVLKAQQYYAHDNISVVIVALNQTADGLNGAVSV